MRSKALLAGAVLATVVLYAMSDQGAEKSSTCVFEYELVEDGFELSQGQV
jgi:hypothetical protein